MNTILWDHLKNKGNAVHYIVNNDDYKDFYIEKNKNHFYENVEYDLDQDSIEKKSFFGKEWYLVASDFNTNNKMSEWYLDCIWFVFVWTDKLSNTISSLWHLPIFWCWGWCVSLLDDAEWLDITLKTLNDIIDKFIVSTKIWTRDIICFGGMYPDQEFSKNDPFNTSENYEKSIKYFTKLIEWKIWFPPVFIWPNVKLNNDTNIFFHNKERLLLIDKPHQKIAHDTFFNPTNRPYISHMFEDMKKIRYDRDDTKKVKEKIFALLSK